MNKLVIISVVLGVFMQCKKSENKPIKIESEVLIQCINTTTETMIHDIFSPPQASRIYCYPNLLAYEIAHQNNPAYHSLTQSISHFPTISKAEKGVNVEMASVISHLEISKKLVFSTKFLQPLQDSLYAVWEEQNTSEFKASKEYAEKAVVEFSEWIEKDNYAETRTMGKYEINLENEAQWQPTPPAYMDAVEPHWSKIRTLYLDSASQFKPQKHPEFSLEKSSAFYKELKEVYDISETISAKGDSSEEIKIAQFWDCNPYVSVSKGHFMFATKKITPGGHWMGIAIIASQQKKLNYLETLTALTQTSMGLFEGFISCWDEKYRSKLVRPETLINKHIDPNWKPILQTPPFPEYTSGHSVVSGASATILTAIFGDDFKFKDTSEIPFGLPVRSFNSFHEAAKEAAKSRMYGGIHYSAAIENGLIQGKQVGNWVVDKCKLKK